MSRDRKGAVATHCAVEVLKVFWDEAVEPSIRVPLWAFFGALERKTIDYQSLALRINHYCYMSE
jgi:hypothetical protein